MRTGGVEIPINGDIVVYREHPGTAERFAVRAFPDYTHGDVFDTHDAAMAAATAAAARAGVSVFYCEMPAAPTLVKPFRTL